MIDILLLIIIPLIIWRFGCQRVKHNHAVLLERGGSYFKQLAPGLQFFIPFLQRARHVHWYNSAIELKGCNIPLHKLRFVSRNVRALGPNGVKVDAKFSICFSIDKVQQAVYEVDNLYQHIEDTGTALLESVVQKSLNTQKLAEFFNADFLSLAEVGVKVESASITRLVARPPKNTDTVQSRLEYARVLQKEFPCTVLELAALITALNSS